MKRGLPVLLALWLFRPLCAGDVSSADEYEIKAAMLLNLTRFVEWPAAKLGEPGSPFVIGILGSDPFGQDLDKESRGRTVAGHPIQVRRLDDSLRPEGCQLLFIGRGERRRFVELAPVLSRASVLTVGDGEKFVGAGSVIGLVLRENRVQIEVNLAAAKRGGLTISSRILKLATVVQEGS